VPKIHKTSSVDSRVQLADDVEIGPNCVIEGAVKLGPGTRLLGHVWLVGPLTVGAYNVFYPNCCVGFDPQHRRYVPGSGAGVAIGNQNIFREGVTIHGATGAQPTTVGNQNYLMCNSHLGHDAIVGDDCTFANGALIGGHVTIANSAFFGGNCAVHQFCRIGRLAILSGGVVVVSDVPPFCMVQLTRTVGGLNIVGLRRSGYREHIKNLKRLFEIFFLSQHTTPVALEQIDRELSHDPLCAEFADFVRQTKRGIARYGGGIDATSE
jgi:UDP-N-acetylglucosamine acyltransferase